MTRQFLISIYFLTALFIGHGQTLITPSITSNDGLSQGFVEDICQDDLGFIWLSTPDGLNRFDGKNFKIFRHIPNNPETLPKEGAIQIISAGKGDLWLRNIEGIWHYSARKSAFSKIEPSLYSNTDVFTITEGPKGDLFILTKGAHMYRARLIQSEVDIQKIALPVDTKSKYALKFHKNDGSISMFYKNKMFTKNIQDIDAWYEEQLIASYFKNISVGSENEISVVYKTQDGAYWLGGNTFMLLYDKKSIQKIEYPKLPQFGHGAKNCRKIMQDHLGNIWVQFNRAVLKVDAKNVVHPNPTDLIFQSQLGPVNTFLEDRSHLLWFGLNGLGIYTTSPMQQAFNHTLKGHILYNILVHDNGRVWTRYNLKDIHKRPDLMERTPMLKADSGQLWIRRGFFDNDSIEYNEFTKINSSKEVVHSIVNFNSRAGQPNKTSYILFQDTDSSIWMLGANDFSRLDLKTFSITDYPSVRKKNEKVAPEISCVKMNSRGLFYIGSVWGLIKFNPKTGNWRILQNALTNVPILSMECSQTNKETLWIGTKGQGLFKFDVATEKITQHYHSAKNHVGNVVYGILLDNSNNLWLSGNSGLSRFNIRSEQVTLFNRKDGTQDNEFNTYSSYKDASGKLFFGGMNGLNAFYPDDIQPNTIAPKVQLTGLRINGKPFSQETGKSLEDVTFSGRLNLKHNQNLISFDYIALDFHNSEKNQYQIKLEGVDKNWVNMGPSTTATYANLSPGNYILRIKGSNNSGFWSNGISFRITITPPIWATWWAYLLYALLFILIILIYIRLRLKRIRLSERLKREKQEAEKLKELDQLKTNFVSNIIHEFRTPLTLMLGPMEKVIKEVEDNHKRELELAQRNGFRILDLVNQLLDMAKLESNSMSLDIRKGNISEHIEQLVKNFEAQAISHEINLCFNSKIKNKTFDFDALKLEKIVLNLLSNAFKFTDAGGSVNIELKANNNTIQLVVEDTGTGMAPEECAKVFDRFYQIDGSQTRHGEGTGIGLSLCNELTKLMNGDIAVQSELGIGTTFTVSIPVIQDDSISALKPNIPRSPFIEKVTLASKETEVYHDAPLVLIIEDNIELQEYIKSTLVKDYNIILASNGQDGINSAIERVPNLIITDVMMPIKDGFEVCVALKSHSLTCHIPIIILTAKTAQKNKLYGIDSGADAYITKPFSNQELQLQIRKLLELRSSLKAIYAPLHEVVQPNENDPLVSDLDSSFITMVNKIIKENLSNANLDAEFLTTSIGMSKSQLYRKLKALTNKSINQYIRYYRLKQSITYLKSGKYSLKELAYLTGFNSQSYFSRSFKEEFGCPPSDYNH